MAFKTIVLLALVCKLSSFAFANDGCEKYYKCDSNKPGEWFYASDLNMKFSCKNESVCNYRYIPVDDAEGSICLPCVSINLVCSDAIEFNCEDNQVFTIGTDVEKYSCPKPYLCNKDKKTSCDPCLLEKCADDAWKCGPGLDDFETPSYAGKCRQGSICKVNKVGPCNEVCEKIDGKSGGRSLMQITEFF